MNATRAVLVTGASTGIGRKITERLVAEGYFVYAGARKNADLSALGSIRNVRALRLDVTNRQDISAAVDAVTMGGRGLYGLVNNAGVVTGGPIVNGNEAEFERVMAINAIGPFRITKAFARLITAEMGRIVMIGSISGILAGDNISAYSMSKHAIEAFTDSLALEVQPDGVQVSVIEPGGFKTELVKNAVERGADYPLPDLSKYEEPDHVAAAVALALSEAQPKRRYLVVANEDEAQRTINKQIEQLVQLNEGHPYTYDRDALVKMLDKALAQSRPRTVFLPVVGTLCVSA